ncbi:MAG: 3'-5' exonuclease [Legionellales bacterium]
MSNLFVFDIETIPDTQIGRRLYQLENCTDDEVAQAMFAKARAQSGRDFLPLHLHKIVAISVVLATNKRVKVWSLGETDADEKDIISRFFSGLDQYTPTLISWNGSGFDLPVLHYRALYHGISAPKYWEVGESDSSFKWNNYLNRYHYRHLDLMDVLAGYQARANAPLTEIAVMLGFPGKMGISGQDVWPTYLTGDLEKIRNYCETDVLNTYLVYLQFELMRGQLTIDAHAQAKNILFESLKSEQKPHLNEFLHAINN